MAERFAFLLGSTTPCVTPKASASGVEQRYHKRYAPSLLARNRWMVADDGRGLRPNESATGRSTINWRATDQLTGKVGAHGATGESEGSQAISRGSRSRRFETRARIRAAVQSNKKPRSKRWQRPARCREI